MATPEEKRHQEGIGFEKENLKALQKINEAIKEQSKILGKPPEKNVEEIKEKKAADRALIDELKAMFKATIGDKDGKTGFIANVKKMMLKYSKILMTLLGVGMIALFSQLDMKQLKEMWKSLKGALKAMYDVLAPIAIWLWDWSKNTLLPETVKGLIKFWRAIETMFVDIKASFEGWSEMTTKEKIEAVGESFKSIGKFFADTGKILINWIAGLFGIEGGIFKEAKKDEKDLKKGVDSIKDKAIEFTTALVTAAVGAFAIGKIFGKSWVGKFLTWPLRLAFRGLLFAGGGLVNIVAGALGMPYKVPGGFAPGGGGDKAPVDGKTTDKKPKGGPKRDPKSGKFVKQQKGIWNAVKGMFGKGAAIFKRIGISLIMPLMSMGPLGWGLLAGLAVGGIVFYYWDEISSGADAAFKYMKDAMKDLLGILKSVMKGAKNMAVDALRGVGLSSLADKLAGTVETEPPPLKTLDELKDEEEGGAKHYKELKKKRDFAEGELEKLENESMRLARLKTGTSGRFGTAGDVGSKMATKRAQVSRLNDQITEQELQNKKKEKKLIKDMAVKMDQSKLLNVDISGTGQAGFDNLSGDAKQKSNLLAKMFGGVRMTSGARTRETGDKAMLWSKDGMGKYKKKWRDLLTEQGISLDSAPGSEERQQAIDALRKGGMMSQHEHGNAIDFSYPKGFSKKNFSGLETTLKGAFPGATLVPESDHVHMSFNKNKSGIQVAQLQADSGIINRAANGQGGAVPPTIINKQGDTVNNSPHSITTHRTTVNHQPELSAAG